MPHSSAAFFQGANNVHLENTTINNTTVLGNIINDQLSGAYGFELQQLMQYCLLGALVDSSEQYDAPQCDEETREAMIQQIDDWARNRSRTSSPLMWMRGGAGAGKSTLAQTIAMMYKCQGLLIGSFFFSNRRANRSNGNALILTLVLQLLIVFPDLRPFIFNEIKRNPTILSGSPEEHMQRLFVNPLNSLSTTISDPQPTLIVIDGLDECDDKTLQARLLRIIASALPQLRCPIRFLISSRPEAHITRAFEKDPALSTLLAEQLNLSAARDANKDVERYLRRRFDLIRQSHPFGEHLPSDWPSDKIIWRLVLQSSGHFIYPSTILKFVDDPNDFPDQRLEALLDSNKRVSTDEPLAPLDALYRHILSGVKDRHLPLVQRFLGVLYLDSHGGVFWPGKIDRETLDAILQLRKGYIDIVLQPLRSLVDVGSYRTGNKNRGQCMRSFHASFFDFLLDPQRSAKFHVNVGFAHEAITHFMIRAGLFDMSRYDSESQALSLFQDFLQHPMRAVISDNVIRTYLETWDFFYVKVLPQILGYDISQVIFDLLHLLSRKDIDPTGQLRVKHLRKMGEALSALHPYCGQLPDSHVCQVGSPTCSTDQVLERLSPHRESDQQVVLNMVYSALACWRPNINFQGQFVHPGKDEIISSERQILFFSDFLAHGIRCGPLQHLVQISQYRGGHTILTYDPAGRSFQSYSAFIASWEDNAAGLLEMTRQHILKCEALFEMGDKAPWSVHLTSWRAPSTIRTTPEGRHIILCPSNEPSTTTSAMDE